MWDIQQNDSQTNFKRDNSKLKDTNELLDSMIVYEQYSKEEGKTFSFLAELL